MISFVFVMAFAGCSDEPGEASGIIPEEYTEIEIGEKTYRVPKIEGASLSYSDGKLTAKYTKVTDIFVHLRFLEYCEEIEYLEIYTEQSVKFDTVPGFPNVKNLYIELGDTIKHLDFSALEKLGQVELRGKVEQLYLPQNLESVSVDGKTDLSLFAECENIREVEILGAADLGALKSFKNLETVYITAGGCDLSPLNDVEFSKLVLSDPTDEELASMDGYGCPIDTLQISDKNISDFSILRKLPNLEVLFLGVSGGENPYVTTFMEPSEKDLDELATPADVSILKEFLKNGGKIYLVPDPNR